MKNAVDGVEDALGAAVVKGNSCMEFKIDSVYRDGMVAMRPFIIRDEFTFVIVDFFILA